MKKNKMMRIASVLLVAVLISTCAISGTFAKYVTKASGEDKARVAKWGVLVSVEGSAFATEYEATDEAYVDAGGEISVKSSNEDKVVAPGTNSEEVGDTYIAKVTGTPEVAARYTIKGENIKDVVLAAGTYTDYTELVKADDGTYGYTKTFTLDKDYAPVKWNLVIKKGSTELNVVKKIYEVLPENYLTIAENYGLTEEGCSFFDAIEILKKVAGNDSYKGIVENALGQLVSGGRNFDVKAEDGAFELSYDFDPLKVMDFTFELTWEWAFEQENAELYDKADTFLGNWAAVELGQEIAGFVKPAAPSSIWIDATLTATATQID